GIIDCGLIEAFGFGVQAGEKFLANDGEPERGVSSIAVGNIVAMDGVGQGAIFFKACESEEYFLHLVYHAGGEQAAGADKGITAPIEKPWIAGDDSLAVVAADHK